MPMGLWAPWRALWHAAVVLTVIRCGSCARRHRLWVSPDHVALSRNFVVSFQQTTTETLPDGVLQLHDLTGPGDNGYRAQVPLPRQLTGNVSFACSYFDHEGEYVVRMLRVAGGEVLVNSTVIDVRWPAVELVSPTSHEALVGDIAVTVTTTASLCTDMQHNRYENSVVLLYHDVNRTLTGLELPTFGHGTVVDEIITGVLEPLKTVQFGCEVIDRAGMYSFLFCSTYMRSIIGTSRPVDVTWSDTGSYQLTFPRTTVFPCPESSSVAVSFEAPSCRGDRDRIRLFAESGRFELRPTGTLEYITEVTVMDTYVMFDCSHFSRDYVGYCFVYVSTAISGAVDTHMDRILCIPVNEIGPPVDGSWSGWSDWGACTVTCGQGQRNRYRLCNNPPADNGGALCQGQTVGSLMCNNGACPKPQVPEIIVTQPTIPPDCTCGCTIQDRPSGFIASSPADCAPADTDTGTWLVHIADFKRIRLEFRTFNLHLQGEWIRVRDGGDAAAKVLAYHTGSRIPGPVVSTGNMLYIEYKVFDGGEPERGFRAYYSTIDGIILPTTPVVAGSTGDDPASGWSVGSINNTAMMIGIIILGAVILISIIITIIATCGKNKRSTASQLEIRPSAAPGGPPSQASGQRPWGPPGHSCSSQSEMSHQSAAKRGRPDGHLGDRSQLYMVRDEGLAYKPESNVSLSSPYHTHSSDTIGMRRPPKIPEDKIPSPYHPHRADFIQMERLRNVGLPYHIGTGSSQSEINSRQSGRTDKNTTTLATKTPQQFAVRGYSAAGSQSSVENVLNGNRPSKHNKYGSLPRSDHRSDTRSDHRHSDHRSDHRSDHHHSDHRSDHRSDHGVDNNLPCVNKEGQLTPLGMALSRNTINPNDYRTPEGLSQIPEGATPPLNWPPAPGEGTTIADVNRNAPGKWKKPSSHGGENAVHPVEGSYPLVNGDSPTGKRPRKLPLTPRQAFFEDTESLGVVTPMTDISSKDNMQIRSPRSVPSPRKNEVISIFNSRAPTSPEFSPSEQASNNRGSSKRNTDRGQSPGGGGRTKRKKHPPNTNNSRKTRRSEDKGTSSGGEDARSAAKLTLYSNAESDEASVSNLLSEPSSPVHHIPALDKKQNTDRLKSVFISDESLVKTFSGGESSRSGLTPRTPRRLPNTPPSGFSPTSNKLKSVLVYSDFSIDQDEPEYDDFIPNLPGTFFENQTPLPTGLSPARRKSLPLKKSNHTASEV